ncbi:O-antigen ligase family protein [Pseudomonas sp. ABY48]|uniref:O-antigen ligase family protein n=1 Tax=Pseudomonas sp. ABY48 TaxID=3402865 RepID=UPI003B4291FD
MMLLLLSAFLSVAVFVFADPLIDNFEKSILGAFPYVVLILIALFVGMAFRRQDLIIVLLLVLFEIAVGLAEYIVGVHSFFSVEYKGQTQIGDTELLYYNRVFGLSMNSSAYAFKVLVGFVILMAIRSELSRRVFLICAGILAVGFITSFNRTAIVAATIGLMFYYATNWRVVLSGCVVGCAVGAFYLSTIVDNLTRGRGELDLSGRDFIFYEFFNVLNQSPFFGNAAQKVWLEINDGLYHAHSSYLEFLVSNGIFISLMFFSGYYLLVVRGRMLAALPLLIYSVFQYGLLWGLVFHDVVFFGLMFYLLRARSERRVSIKTPPETKAIDV